MTQNDYRDADELPATDHADRDEYYLSWEVSLDVEDLAPPRRNYMAEQAKFYARQYADVADSVLPDDESAHITFDYDAHDPRDTTIRVGVAVARDAVEEIHQRWLTHMAATFEDALFGRYEALCMAHADDRPWLEDGDE